MKKYLIALCLFSANFFCAQIGDNQTELHIKIAQLDEIIKTEPTAENFYSRGFLKYKAGDLKGALPDYDMAIKIEPENFDSYYSRGMLKDKLEDYKGAADDYTVCVMLDPNSAKAHFNRGFSKSKANDFLGAVDDYSKCIAINPKHFAAYLNRGIIRQNQNSYQDALSDFDQAEAIKPGFVDAIQNRAICRAHLGRKDAIDDFNKAVSLDSQNPENYYNRALYFINYKIAGNYCSDLKIAQRMGFERAKKVIAEKCK